MRNLTAVNVTFPQLLRFLDLALLLLRVTSAAVFFGSGVLHLKDPAGRAKSIEMSPAFTVALGIAEVPIAVVAAAEVASFWWFGPLRVVLGHVVGRAVLDVEFVSNADHHVSEGRRWLQEGEMEKALAEFDKALSIDRRHAGGHLGRGIALKLRGDKASAREAFREAEHCDPRSEAGREARRHLDNL